MRDRRGERQTISQFLATAPEGIMLDFVEWVTGEWGVTALAATGHLVIAIVPGEEKTVRAHMLEVGRFDTASDALRALLSG